MPQLEAATNEQLQAELKRRGAFPRCGCGKWGAYLGRWDEDGYTLRCSGCKKSVKRCRC